MNDTLPRRAGTPSPARFLPLDPSSSHASAPMVTSRTEGRREKEMLREETGPESAVRRVLPPSGRSG